MIHVHVEAAKNTKNAVEDRTKIKAEASASAFYRLMTKNRKCVMIY